LLNAAQPWRQVRCWLRDLSEEANAGLRDGTLPPVVGLDRVWITADGRAVLLEFPAPGAPPVESLPLQGPSDIQRFLTGIADAALSPVRPLYAAQLVNTLRERRLEDPALIAGNIRAAMAEAAAVSPLRRVFSVALWPLISLVLAFILGAVVAHESRWFDRVWAEHYPELPSLRRAKDLRFEGVSDAMERDSGDLSRALNTHIAGYFGKVVEDDAFWNRAEVQALFWPAPGKTRRELRKLIKSQGTVSAEALLEADRKLASVFAEWKTYDRNAARQIAYIFFVGGISLGVLVSLVWTLCTGTPLGMRVCGLSLVRWKDGRLASRLHAALRLFISWLPAHIALLLLGLAGAMDAGAALMALALGAILTIFAVSLLVAVRRPERGLADQLCGTAIVPR